MLESVEKSFGEKVCEKVRLVSEGLGRFRVFTPFLFDDGDHLTIILKRERERWMLSDEGHTYMHLTYDLDGKDLQKGTRQRIITNALSMFSIQDRDGELVVPVEGDRYGDALYSFVQSLLRITDVTFLSRERVRSTFMEDFWALMEESVPENRRAFDWHDVRYDPQGMYTVDCRINGMPRPLFVYALPGDDRARDATIALLQFEKWGIPNHSVAIFENQEEINRRVLARLSNVFEKQFSDLGTTRERVIKYIQDALS